MNVWNSCLAYFRAACRPAGADMCWFFPPWKSQTNCNLHSSNSRLLPLAISASLFFLVHSIAGSKLLFSFSSWRMWYIVANWSRTSLDGMSSSMLPSDGALPVEPDSVFCDLDAAFFSCNSERNVPATENCPSRKRCIAIALSIRCSWEDIASCSVLGSGLSLKS